MLAKTFVIHPEVNKNSHSAYSKPSFLFYGDSVIKSCQRTQLGDPESLFSDSIQDLTDSLESMINVWYLDDGNLSDDYRTVSKDLKIIDEAEKTLGLEFNPTKCEKIFSVQHWKATIDNFNIFPKTLRDENAKEK